MIDCSFRQSLHWKSSLHVLSKSLEISFIVHTTIYLFMKKRVCVKTGHAVVITMMDYWSRRFLTSTLIRTCSSAGSAIAFRCSRISFSVNSLNTLSSENIHRDTLFSLSVNWYSMVSFTYVATASVRTVPNKQSCIGQTFFQLDKTSQLSSSSDKTNLPMIDCLNQIKLRRALVFGEENESPLTKATLWAILRDVK